MTTTGNRGVPFGINFPIDISSSSILITREYFHSRRSCKRWFQTDKQTMQCLVDSYASSYSAKVFATPQKIGECADHTVVLSSFYHLSQFS